MLNLVNIELRPTNVKNKFLVNDPFCPHWWVNGISKANQIFHFFLDFLQIDQILHIKLFDEIWNFFLLSLKLIIFIKLLHYNWHLTHFICPYS